MLHHFFVSLIAFIIDFEVLVRPSEYDPPGNTDGERARLPCTFKYKLAIYVTTDVIPSLFESIS